MLSVSHEYDKIFIYITNEVKRIKLKAGFNVTFPKNSVCVHIE